MVKFKSIPAMFVKEKDGRKPNTLRKIDMKDKRFHKLLSQIVNFIEIENSETGEIFQRAITDVTAWDDWMIISWYHSISEKGVKK